MARDQIGEMVSAFELMNGQGLTFLSEKLPQIRQPFDPAPAWCVLVEVGLMQGMDPQAVLARLFEEAIEAGIALDGVIAQSQQQAAEFWAVREHLPEANRLVGSISSHDISLPLGAIADFVAEADAQVARGGAFRVNCFGHVGDGNLHYNLFPAVGASVADHAQDRDRVKQMIHDIVHAMGGSVSAEHGIGRFKVDDLERYGDPAKLSAMRAIKSALDPLGIMNPGAVLRARD
jgi:FAD/FMN-containing dehydrogenase